MATAAHSADSVPPSPRGAAHRAPSPPPSGDPPKEPDFGSAPMRALQLLRERQPLPARRRSVPPAMHPRRQSVPEAMPPRGGPPLPLIDRPGPDTTKPPTPDIRLFGAKHPTPGTHPPSAVKFDPGRRHTTGNLEYQRAPGSVRRPPPPRGPPPSPAMPGSTTMAGAAPLLQPTREDSQRRLSDFRGPPPGRPPPGRRPSATPNPASLLSGPEPSRRIPQQQQRQQQPQGVAVGGGMHTVGDTREFEEGYSRRVSFSAYGGQPPQAQQEGENVYGNNAAQGDTASRVITSGSSSGHGGSRGQVSVAPTSRPLPQLHQQRRISQDIGSSGRPPPPRPSGDPPANQVRRYSISNEFSGGFSDFSRRMSKITDPRGPFDGIASEASGLQSVAQGNGPRRLSTESSNVTVSLRPGSNGGGKPPPPITSSEGQAAVLWYNMGVTRQKELDAKGAVECYERAAQEGHPKAQHNLAAIYEKGTPGVPKDDVKAVRLFKLAADQGLAESCYSLAMHLKFGLGIEQDDARCVFYLEKASEHGLAKAIFNLGLMYEKRRGIAPDAPEADLLEVTRECYQAAAEAGVTKAMVNLGVLYMSGRLHGHEQGGALEWFKKAADRGDLSGLWNLSLCYERGIGVSQDTVAAQALQQQCRDREKESQPERPGSAAGAGAAGRRASAPPPFVPPSTDGDNHPGELGERQHRRRSLSVPAATPPPPLGRPPARRNVEERSPDTEQDGSARRGSSYKYVPARDVSKKNDKSPEAGKSVDRRPSAGHGDVVNGTAAAAAGERGRASSASVTSPPRKSSLLLKPTPLAIARVKAAVERRKRLEVAAMSVAGGSPG